MSIIDQWQDWQRQDSQPNQQQILEAERQRAQAQLDDFRRQQAAAFGGGLSGLAGRTLSGGSTGSSAPPQSTLDLTSLYRQHRDAIAQLYQLQQSQLRGPWTLLPNTTAQIFGTSPPSEPDFPGWLLTDEEEP